MCRSFGGPDVSLSEPGDPADASEGAAEPCRERPSPEAVRIQQFFFDKRAGVFNRDARRGLKRGE